MLDVTKSATKEVKAILAKPENKDLFVRLYIDGVGWGGPRLGIALDAKQNDDVVINKDEIDYVIDEKSEKLLSRYGGAKLDYTEQKYYGSGFSLRMKESMGGSC